MIQAFLGILVGAVLGLTGAGGGILAVPALVFGLGWPVSRAAPIALIAVATAAALGAVEGLRRGLVRYRAAAFMASVGMLLAPAGLRVAAAAPEKLLLLAFAAAMLVVAGRMFRHAASTRGHGAPPPARIDPATGRLRWTARTTGALAAIGAASGFLTGLLGVGGGFLIVPALRRFTDIAMPGIVATSLAVIAIVSAGSVLVASLGAAATAFQVAGPFAAGAAGGMVLGRIGAHRLDAAHLQRIFAVVAAGVAVGLVVRALRT